MEADRERLAPASSWGLVPGLAPDEQAALFGSIAMSATDAVVASDLDGLIVWVNPVAADLFGWPREQLLGRPFTVLLPEEAQARVLATRDRTLRGEHAAPFLTVAQRRSGETFEVSVTPGVRRDAQGRPRGTYLILRDVTEEMGLRRELRKAEQRLASQEAFFRGLNREASDVTMVSDAAGNLVYVTPSVKQVLGYEPDTIGSILGSDLLHPDDLRGQEQRRRRVRDVPGARERFTIRIQDAEGAWRWFETTATNCTEDPAVAGIVVNLREVTPEVETQQALRDSEARYRAIAETAQEGILAVSPEGEILFANERLADILSLPMEEVYALGGEGLFAPAKAAHAARRLADRGREAGPEHSAFHYKRPDGSDRVLHVSASALTSADGSVLGSLAMVYDVTEQRAAEETLRRQALHDALTGLPNRILFVDRLDTAAARQARADGGAVAVLFLDLDNFKEVNDVHGHEAGDRVLAAVAGRVEAGVRGTDTVARIGGDEFAVICEGADAQTASLVASRIQQALTEPVVVDGKAFPMSMSIGIAMSPPHRTEDLLRFADIAMYQAKAASRGSVVVFDEPGADPDRS